MRIILKKIPAVQRDNASSKTRNSQAIKIMSLLVGKFGTNVEIPQEEAAAFLQENKASFTRHPSAAWHLFMWYLKSYVAEGCVEVLGGDMDRHLKTREEIERRIKVLEESIAAMHERDDERESMAAMVVALRWAIGAPSEETREAKGNIWK